MSKKDKINIIKNIDKTISMFYNNLPPNLEEAVYATLRNEKHEEGKLLDLIDCSPEELVKFYKQKIELKASEEHAPLLDAKYFAYWMFIKNNLTLEKAEKFWEYYNFIRAQTATKSSESAEVLAVQKEISELKKQLNAGGTEQDLNEIKNELKQANARYTSFLAELPEQKYISLLNTYKKARKSYEKNKSAARSTVYLTAKKDLERFLDSLPQFDAIAIGFKPKIAAFATEDGLIEAGRYGSNYHLYGAIVKECRKNGKDTTEISVNDAPLPDELNDFMYALSLCKRGLNDYDKYSVVKC